MGGGDLADQCEADAAALALGGEEGNEDLLALIGRNARAVVGHRDRNPAVWLPICREGDLSGRGVAQSLESIADEIDERLVEELGVHRELQGFGRDVGRHADVAIGEVAREEPLDPCKQALHRHDLHARRERLREPTVAAHEVQEPLAPSGNGFQSLTRVRQGTGTRVVRRQLLQNVADDLRFSLVNAPGKGAYPISGATWAVCYVKQPKDKAKLLKDFLWWATHDGQEFCEAEYYARLPKGLVEKIEKKLEMIKGE